MPQLSRIAIYPLKSFDAILVNEAVVLPNGALQHDRQFALVDPSKKFINAKWTSAVHGLVLELDPVARALTARRRDETTSVLWDIDRQRDDLQRWLSNSIWSSKAAPSRKAQAAASLPRPVWTRSWA